MEVGEIKMKKKIILSLVFVFAFFIQVKSQEPKMDEPTILVKQSTVDACAKAFDEVLALRNAINAIKAELETNKTLRAKVEAYNAELLKVVQLLVSSEKRDKSFFKKLVEGLGKVLKTATDPNVLTTIVAIIVIARKL